MNDIEQRDLSFETLSDAQPRPLPAAEDQLPELRAVLKDLSPLPRGALFLGVAEDRLPVLLNLQDPVPGPVLVAGDSGSGKTRLLKTIAQGVDQTHDPDQVRYAVLADRPEEWESIGQSAHCEAILGFQQPLTTSYVSSLVNWAHSNKRDEQYVLLLVDGLEGLDADSTLHQSLSWLLLRGPARRVWPMVTLKATRASAVNEWLPAFRTRLCGHIAADRDVTHIAGSTETSFEGLKSGSQFAMREHKTWLPFWLPRAE
jgi:hypothetical protein